jgi:hypothetical protein
MLHAFCFHQEIDLIMEDIAACFFKALYVLSKRKFRVMDPEDQSTA